jgi:acetyltransferase-like isoleucine patch superfamily enzyme
MIKRLLKLARRFKRRLASLTGPEDLDGRITVGEHTYGVSNQTCFLVRETDRVKIGKYCSLAPGVKIVPSGEHNFKLASTFPFYAHLLNRGVEKDTHTKGGINIGNDVWIGINGIILSGVSIGDGAVIAAGAVVVDDVPPYAIVSGVPAKIMGYRFSDNIIQSLLEIQWWNWDVKKIVVHVDDFYLDVNKFIEKHKDVDQ